MNMTVMMMMVLVMIMLLRLVVVVAMAVLHGSHVYTFNYQGKWCDACKSSGKDKVKAHFYGACLSAGARKQCPDLWRKWRLFVLRITLGRT